MASEDTPHISIIVATYNRSWCIARVIESVLGQEFQNWELIIVDDGSVDETKQVVDEYLSDSRIRYFYKKNGGVGSARNLGIERSIGNMLVFIDSDDEFIKGAFDILVRAGNQYRDFDIFILGAVNQHGSPTYFIRGDRQSIDFSEFIRENRYKGEGYMCFRRIVFSGEDDRFDEEINGGESIWIFGVLKKYKAILIDEIVRVYHMESDDSMVNSKLTVDKMRNIVRIQSKLIEKYGSDFYVFNRKKLGESYLVLARALVLTGGFSKSIRCFLRGVLYSPFDIRRVLLYCISIFDRNLYVNNLLNILNKKIVYK